MPAIAFPVPDDIITVNASPMQSRMPSATLSGLSDFVSFVSGRKPHSSKCGATASGGHEGSQARNDVSET
jgi:hypothetical protein